MSDELVAVLGRIADAISDRNRIERERLDKEYPVVRKLRPAEITSAGDEKKSQYDDRASDEEIRKTEAALPKSRFRERLGKGT